MYFIQIYMFSFSTEPTTSTQAPTTKVAIPPTDTSEVREMFKIIIYYYLFPFLSPLKQVLLNFHLAFDRFRIKSDF